MPTPIQLRSGPAANVAAASAIDGEPLWTTDTHELWVMQSGTKYKVGGSGTVTWATLSGKPSTFPPDAHTHPLSALTQSSATTGQVATWNGSAWAPAAIPAQAWSTLTGVPSTFAPSAHTHSPSDITAGGATTGQVLTWNGSAYAPTTPVGTGDMLKSTYDINADGVVDAAAAAPWSGITGKPSTFAPSAHTHPLTDISTTGAASNFVGWNGVAWSSRLVGWADVQGKPTTFTPAAHTHALADLTQSGATTGQVPSWNGTAWAATTPTVAWGNVTSVPSTFAPSAHTHAPSDITAGGATSGQALIWSGSAWAATTIPAQAWAAITGKPTTFVPSAHTHPLADLTQSGATTGQVVTWNGSAYAPTAIPAQAYSSLTGVPSTFTPSAHTHPLSDLTQSSATTGQVVTWNGSAYAPATPSVAWANVSGTPATYAPSAHTHSLSALTQSSATTGQVPQWSGTAWVAATFSVAWSAITGVPSTFAPSAHTHALTDLTQSSATSGQVVTWSGTAWAAAAIPAQAYSSLTGVPSTFPPSAHTHPLSALTQSSATTNQVATWNGTAWVAAAIPAQAYSSLTGVPSTFTPSAHTHALSDLLQGGATANQVVTWNGSSYAPATVAYGNLSGVPSTFTPSTHTHAAADITSGTVATARLGSGTASAETFHRGDQTWAAPAPAVSGGRLTVTSGSPVATSASAVSTLYFMPFSSNRILVPDATNLVPYVFSQLSIALSGLTAGSLYDVFAYVTGGAVTLKLGTAWASATARVSGAAGELEWWNGLQTNKYTDGGQAARTMLYLGTIRAVSATTTIDSLTQGFVYNAYNQVPRALLFSEATSHAYSGGYRAWNNNAANKFEFILGNPWDMFYASAWWQGSVPAGSLGAAGGCLDAVTSGDPLAYSIGVSVGMGDSRPFTPGLGYHYLAAVENTNSSPAVTYSSINLRGVINR